ncbi:MFS transporter [Coccidioides immitis RS]|uniref:MFS transporter n=3 Tax=Coccidioides immitis TaxID=5501 RepID=J3K6C1_COCIM|nr:MFS transporter [Coccidioides immitis RS]EAS30102.3 MFS transporter [Coccidioides immitis RS]KMP07049.1 hypothetical protein CIRG_06730 [Coccidioides immitis RMSCC 2394]KMU86774.1 hypothetical protein CIHG_04563 [Coccidioides immitis H538.4]TPX22131.1 hypothetical protein DIZ76_013996 [Coccidioides immitis]
MAPNHLDRSDLVPGTVHLVDVAGEAGNSKREKDIVLVPRPSADPEDPLNWSRRRKLLHMAMLFIYTLGVGIPTTLQYSVLADITRDTGITTAQLVNGTGLMFLFLGWGCLLWQPIAITYGRRGVYVLSCLFCVPMMVWTAYSKSYGEWYAHRIIMGLAASPIESLPEVSIPDIFFAHERGRWMGGYVLFLFGSNFIAPLIAGWFNDAYGWRWVMHFGAMISAVATVIIFFFMEETLYFRKTVEGEELDVSSSDGNSLNRENSKEKREVHAASTSENVESFPLARTYIQKLNLFVFLQGRPTIKQMLTMMYRPLLIILYFPCTSWAGFLYGINLSWYNVLNATASPVLSAAPYNWTAALVGSAYAAPIIGAIFACAWSGIVADKVAIYLARRNKGVREPEHRLWPLVVSGVVSTAGLIIWGVGASYGVHWVGLEFGLGMLAFGCITGGSIAISYNIDCFKELSGESMVSVIIIRNTLGFGFSYAITPWIEAQGLRNCFITVGMVSLATTATFLIMTVWGKKLRKFSRDKYWEYVSTSVAGTI